jgi:hypothetical protein
MLCADLDGSRPLPSVDAYDEPLGKASPHAMSNADGVTVTSSC